MKEGLLEAAEELEVAEADDAGFLELETVSDEAGLLGAADELETARADDAVSLETALEEVGLLEAAVELEAAGADDATFALREGLLEAAEADEEIELAFVDVTELLDATADDIAALVEELEDLDPCLIAKALSGTLEVAVTDSVEFFKLQSLLLSGAHVNATHFEPSVNV